MASLHSSLISAPEGLFEPYFNTAFSPEDIRDELDKLRSAEAGQSGQREALYGYRFFTQKDGRGTMVCDRFVMFWVELLFCEKTVGHSKWQLKSAYKRLVKMLVNDDLAAAFGGHWPDERVLYEQLYNSARRYIDACEHDSVYGAYAFGIMRLNQAQVIQKLLAEFIDAAVCFSHRCGLLADYPVVGKAALHAWMDAVPKTDDRVWERIERTAGSAAATAIVEILSGN